MACVVVLALCAIVAHSLSIPPGMYVAENQWMSEKSAYPRKATVNLNEPPKQRWVHLIDSYRNELIPYFEKWQQILDDHKDIDQPAWANALQNSIEQDYIDEMESILHTFNHSSMTWSNLLLFQAIYELGSPSACSQVIAAAEDGTVIHGRNLDYRVISPVIEITFMKDGIPLFVAPQYLAQIGLHTGLKHNQWSFGQNTRGVSGDTVDLSLKRLQAGAKLYPNFVRSLMEQDLSYSKVVHQMQNVPLLKDMYFVIAGAGSYEGIVIARAADPRYKHFHELSPQNKEWFLFQTNDEWDQIPRDTRRPSGVSALNALSQKNVQPMTILKIMMTPPVYVSSNVVLFMMAPKSGKFCSVLGAQNKDDTSIGSQCELTGWQSGVGVPH